MPTDETQHLDGNVENEDTTTTDETRESEDASEDLASLFEDDSQADAPVTRDELKRLEKGIKKIASMVGRTKAETPKEKTEVKEGGSVLKNLYFKANPEAQIIWDEVVREAKALGRDPYELYEGSSYLKGEAKARTEAKAEEERNKAKVEKPSTQTDSSPEDISKIKAEDVQKLSPAQKVAWIKEQARRERMRAE